MPLGIAAQKGFIEIVRILLGAGANVNHQNKVRYVYSDTVACYISILVVVCVIQHSCTPLYYASKKGECALVELLLKNGANVSICSKVGKQY